MPKNNMNLIGYRIWSHNDNDRDGFTDKDSSYYKWINDVKKALDYVTSVDNYDKIDTMCFNSYTLKVISVKDSMAIAELIEIPPWVKVNIGDGVKLK